jgi:hypothetical protein
MDTPAGNRRPEISATKAVAVVAVAATVGIAVAGASRQSPPATTAAMPDPGAEPTEAAPQPREKAGYANQRAAKRPRSRSE